MEKSAIVVVINSLLIYDYVDCQEGVNPDPYKVRTLSIYMFTGTVFTGGIPVDLQQERRETQERGAGRRAQGRAAEAGGWWVRATPRWAALRTRRGGAERVKLECFDDNWLLMGGAVGKKGRNE